MGSEIRHQLNRPFLSLGFFIASFASLAAIGAGYWDATWHKLLLPETFWTPPHIALYASVGTLIISLVAWAVLTRRSRPRSFPMRLYTLAMAGVAIQLFAGGWDEAWHRAFGLDMPLSPPHITLLVGGGAATFAVFWGLNKLSTLAWNGPWRNMIAISQIAAWAALWRILVFGIGIASVPNGFGSQQPAATALFDAVAHLAGVFMLLVGSSIIRHRWAATLLAAFNMVVVYTATIVPDPSLHSFSMPYALYLAPSILIDLTRQKKVLRYDSRSLLPTGLALGIFYHLLFHQFNTIYFGAMPSISAFSIFIAALAGGLGALLAVFAVRVRLGGQLRGMQILAPQDTRV